MGPRWYERYWYVPIGLMLMIRQIPMTPNGLWSKLRPDGGESFSVIEKTWKQDWPKSEPRRSHNEKDISKAAQVIRKDA